MQYRLEVSVAVFPVGKRVKLWESAGCSIESITSFEGIIFKLQPVHFICP